MGVLIICNDNDIDKNYNLVNAEIIEEKEKLYLRLNTESEKIKYCISKDTREPDINMIKEYIQKEIDDALKNVKPLKISEYLVREYIYVGDIEKGERRQFTAIRQ